MADLSERTDRQQRRRQERRQLLSLSSLFAVGFILALSGALYLSWLVYPLTEANASPAVLRVEHKADYIYMVSQGYAQDGDWARAEARLNKLNDPAIADTTLSLVEQALREGRPSEAIRNLARLAEQLGAEGGTLALFAPTPVLAAVLPTVTATAPAALETESEAATTEPEPTIEPTATLPLPPTATAVPLVETAEIEETPPLYRLLSQNDRCEQNSTQPAIEVVVVDAALAEIRGVEVQLTWDGGSDRALTGFKSGAGAGYADFSIETERSYTVSMSDGSGEIGGLQSDTCADGAGVVHWQLRYQALTVADQ